MLNKSSFMNTIESSYHSVLFLISDCSGSVLEHDFTILFIEGKINSNSPDIPKKGYHEISTLFIHILVKLLGSTWKNFICTLDKVDIYR